LLKKSFLIRRLARVLNARLRYVDWGGMLKEGGALWKKAVGRDGSPRILVATCVGSQIGSAILEGLLAVALTLRGARVEFLLCDAVLPACMGCEIGYIGKHAHPGSEPVARHFCATCFVPAWRSYRRTGLPVLRFGEALSAAEVRGCREKAQRVPPSEIRSFRYEGLSLGEQAHAGALRFFARGDLEGEPAAGPVIGQYLEASLITAAAFERILDSRRYDCAVFNHGIYVPQGIVGALCRKKGVRVVNWNAAYRKRCFIFSHQDTYHHTMMSEPVATWENMDWSRARDAQLMDYLASRRQGTRDWIWFHERPQTRVEESLGRMGVDPRRPLIGLLTSVMWDAALHYPSNAFPDMLSWIFHSIDYFQTRRDLQLVIRIHPAEIQGGLPSRQRVLDEIRRRYAEIPGNVFVVPPESRLSTYAVMEKCNAVAIYNTKTGIELAAMGIPVIVAGEAWIRNKGLAVDVSSPEEYTQALNRLPLPGRMTEAETTRARKYAYHFFFRRMIPLEPMEPTGGNPPYRMRIDSLDALCPGKSAGLDLICDGILRGTDFVYDGPDPELARTRS
jgi:hypothetical protein